MRTADIVVFVVCPMWVMHGSLSRLCTVCVWGTVGGSRSRRYIVYAPAKSSPAVSTSAAPWLTLCPTLCPLLYYCILAIGRLRLF